MGQDTMVSNIPWQIIYICVLETLTCTTFRVSYDDKETWQLKKQYAADKCLAGTLEWAVDMNVIAPKDTKDDL